MIALEVSSAAGRPPLGGVGSSIRSRVRALLRLDPDTRYDLCYRLSRWRKGHLFRPDAPNARIRVIQDPLNALLIPRTRLFHSFGIFVPRTPRTTKLLSVHDLNAVRNPQWVRPDWHERRTRRIRESVERADHVVTYSDFTKGEICEEFGVPEERVHPVLLGVDAEAFRAPPHDVIESTRKKYGDYVISIGLTTPRKNFPGLVEALAPLAPLRLVIVGQPSDGETALEEAIERHGMRERTVRLRGISHEELVTLLAAARVCAVASLYEGFGLTVLEAMAAGTPVVCSSAASLPDVAGDAAFLVDARDVEALREAIRSVHEDREWAERLRERGLRRAREMSWEASARALHELYQSLL